MEWCENQLIGGVSASSEDAPSPLDLSRQYLCTGMTRDEIGKLGETGTIVQFPAGSTIFRVGEAGYSLFFLLDGEVEASINTEANRRLRLTTVEPGMVFGEIALLSRSKRTANAVATREAMSLEIRFDAIDDATKIKMLANMVSYFAGKIDHDTQLIRQLG